MFKALWDFFWPPQFPTQEQTNWAIKASLSLAAGFGVIAFLASPLGLAWAGDVDKRIESKIKDMGIEAKMAVLADGQKIQGGKIDSLTELVVESLAKSTAKDIREVISKRCKAQTFAERDSLLEEKRRLQNLYKKYTGENYTEPACTEL